MRHVTRVVLATFLALLSCAVTADPANYSFQVTATTGPLAGTVANGTFSFDDGIIPPGGGNVNQEGLLIDLDFAWNGTAYTEATANTGFLSFNPAGDLTGFCFGNNVDGGVCSTRDGLDQWIASDGGFHYSVAGQNDTFRGTLSLLETTAVPEPDTVFLILAGLLVLVIHGTRYPRRTTVG